MEETLRNSGSFTIDFVENEVNRLVIGLFLKKKKSSKLDEFPSELSLTLKSSYRGPCGLWRQPPRTQTLRHRPPLWDWPSLSRAGCFQPTLLRASAADAASASVAVGGCFMSPGGSSHKGKTPRRPFVCLF